MLERTITQVAAIEPTGACRRRRYIDVLPLVALAMAGTAPPAFAQQAPSPADATDQDGARDPNGEKDIVVTAQRTSQSIQRVPVAVSALGSADLVNANVASLEDLSSKVPGFVSSNASSYGASPLAIRGVSGAAGGGNVFSDDPVAIYQNDVYVFGPGAAVGNLLDVENIQVLRGPQGTLFGRNSTAGAVLIQTARPTFEVEGFANAELTSLDAARFSGALSGPIVDDVLAARVAVGYTEDAGWARNTFLSQKLGSQRQVVARGSLRFQPSSTIRSDLSFEYSDATYHPVSIALSDLRNIAAVSPFVARPDLRDALHARNFLYDVPQNSYLTSYLVTWQNSWQVSPAVELRSVTGFRDLSVSGSQDSDGSPRPLIQNFSGGAPRRLFSEELLAIGKTGALQWTVGGYYAHTRAAVDPFDIQSGAFLFGLGRNVRFRSHERDDIYAAFADVTYAFTDRLSFGLGGRYTREEKDFDNDSVVTTIRSAAAARALGFVVPATLAGRAAGSVLSDPPALSAKKAFKSFTPRSVLNYQATRNVLIYGSVSRGYKSGGFNAFYVPAAGNTTVPTFAPEKITAYEIGVKSDLFDRHLRLNLSGYHYDYKDLQIRLGVPTGGISIANAGSARINGLDVEAVLRPFGRFEISQTASLIDAKFTRGSVPGVREGTYSLGSDIPLVNIDLDGNRLTRSPKFQTFTQARYTMDVDPFEITGIAGYRHQSRTYFLETNQVAATYQQAGWNQLDLRLTALHRSSGWSASLFATNVADKRVITQVASYNGLPVGIPNRPREIGLQFGIRF